MKTTENEPVLTRRFPGAAPFEAAGAALFFGRKTESRDLFDRVAVEKMTVLFGPPGMGKTSLIQAGLDPILRQNGFLPLYFRFNALLSDEKEPTSPELFFEKAFRKQFADWSGEAETQPLAGLSFWELLRDFPFEKAGQKPLVPVLIFDQIEGFFERCPTVESRRRFLELLAGALSDRLPEHVSARLKSQLADGQITVQEAAVEEKPPVFRLLISIRSEMLHHLDYFSDQLPTIFRSRFHVKPLARTSARDAIIRPAALEDDRFASNEFAFSTTALDEILEALRDHDEAVDGVDPFKLQLFCSEIEDDLIERRTPEGFVVKTDFYGGPEGIERSLADFYEKQIGLLDADRRDAARLILEEGLVNDDRRAVLREESELLKMLAPAAPPDGLLAELEHRRLVSKEPRAESLYYRLSSDALVAPVWEGRQTRRAARARADAAAQAAVDFEAARKLRAEARRRQNLWAAILLATGFAALAFFAFEKRREAETHRKVAETQTGLANIEKEKAEKAHLEADELFERAELGGDSLHLARAERDLERAKKLLAESDLFNRGGEPRMADGKKREAKTLLDRAKIALLRRIDDHQKPNTHHDEDGPTSHEDHLLVIQKLYADILADLQSELSRL